MRFWDNLGAVVLDMDGVIFIGRDLRRGITDLVARFERDGINYRVLTNTSSSSPQDISASLADMGLMIEPARITNSSELVANYVRAHVGAETAFTLGGGSGLASALRTCGIKPLDLETLSFQEIQVLVASDHHASHPLVLGYTRHYDYELATKVIRLEKCISGIYTAGADRRFQGELGAMPAIGWTAGSVAALLDKQPHNPSKPDPFALDYVLGKLGQPASRTALIGDSLSDIQAGNKAGCRTVLLLGGVTSQGDLAGLTDSSVPDRVIRELTELL